VPYPNEHAARLHPPGRYVRFRRENDKLGTGVHVIWGVRGDGTVEIQAIRFDKRRWTEARAREWLREHGYKPIRFEPAIEGAWEMAEWTTKYVNDLPDSAFLYIAPGGKKDEEGKTVPRTLRYFPYRDHTGKIDLPHLRNAIARIPQSNLPAAVKARLQAKARSLLEKQKAASVETLPVPATLPGAEGRFAKLFDRRGGEGDVPVRYFRKDVIRVGTFRHPTEGWSLKVTPERLAHWAETWRKMRDAGIQVPVNRDHKPGVENHLGYVRDLRVEGNRLVAIIEARGQEAIDLCQRVNQVSIEVLPDYIDGKGRHYGEAVVGVALTARPVVPAQEGFVPIAAGLLGEPAEATPLIHDDTDSGDKEMDEKVLAGLREVLGVDDLDEATLVESVKGALEKARASAAEAAEKAGEREVALSLDPDVADQLAEVLDMRLGALVEMGRITPAVADRLRPLLLGTPENRPAYLLTRRARPNAKHSLAREILDALELNDPVELGEKTRLQAREVHRQVPDENEPVNPKVQERMIAFANAGVRE